MKEEVISKTNLSSHRCKITKLTGKKRGIFHGYCIIRKAYCRRIVSVDPSTCNRTIVSDHRHIRLATINKSTPTVRRSIVSEGERRISGEREAYSFTIHVVLEVCYLA